MMFELGERSTDINIAKQLYEKNGFLVEGIKKNAMIIDEKYADEFYMAKIYNNKIKNIED